MNSNYSGIQDLEIDLLLTGIQRRYGYDFKRYSRGSLARRVNKFVAEKGLTTISEVQNLVLHDQVGMRQLIDILSVNVTSMFRDARFFLALRRYVLPRLHTYPYLRLWVAGCSTGEEAFSLAILLHEAGLLKRSRIYATDYSDTVVQRAKRGVVPLEKLKEYTRNYRLAGGERNFSEYYTAKYDKAIVPGFLTQNISFATHNLATDQSFNEFHVILCRNVMIYFDKDLQEHVMHLFRDSIATRGFLGIGAKESIFPMSFREQFKELGSESNLFQLVQ